MQFDVMVIFFRIRLSVLDNWQKITLSGNVEWMYTNGTLDMRASGVASADLLATWGSTELNEVARLRQGETRII